MALKPIVRIVNLENNNVEDREMNDIEFSDWLETKRQIEIMDAEKEDKQKKKEAAADKLLALGLSSDDLKALGLG